MGCASGEPWDVLEPGRAPPRSSQPIFRERALNAGIKVATVLLALPHCVLAQSFLEQFSYEGLRFTGIGFEVGGIVSDRLTPELSSAIRVDYGNIAPRVRVLFGAAYVKGDFQDSEIVEFENQLCRIVGSVAGCPVEIGDISWADIELDLDLQYVMGSAGGLTGLAGVGAAVHVLNGAGDAIADTFVEDALDRIDLGLNLSLGAQVRIARSLYFVADARAGLATELRTAGARAGFMYRVSR